MIWGDFWLQSIQTMPKCALSFIDSFQVVKFTVLSLAINRFLI